GKIVAFISAIYPTKFPPGIYSPIGWIKIVVTSPQSRYRGFASLLYDRVVEEFKMRGVTEVRISDRGNWHFWPGVDLRYEDGLDFFEKRGFTKEVQELDYSYDLRSFFYPRRVLKLKEQLMNEEQINIRLAKQSEKEDLGAWIEEKFSIFWRNETEYAFYKETPSVMIAKDRTGKILGFATYNGVAPGRFGPAGVDPVMRGKGLGTVLLFEAFQALKEEGKEEAIVHWTDLLFYYTQVPGLSGVRHYWIMHREL
ncbi:MAG: GNAT family N-acetyltransferase, partial [Nitrososphaerales archaeon]